jgi:hypothetical protein
MSHRGLTHDPTIPRPGQDSAPEIPKTIGPMAGHFVRTAQGEIRLEATRRSHSWPLSFVSILQGFWGSVDNAEGVSKMPRVREYDAEGKVVVEGDRVLIEFIDGNPNTPVVRGGVRGVGATDFLPYNQEPSKGPVSDQNRLAGRMVPLDADGKPQGVMEWELSYDDTAQVRFSVTELQAPPLDNKTTPPGPKTYVSMSAKDGGEIQMGTKTGEVVRMVEGNISIVTKTGHVLILDENDGIQIAQAKPGRALAEPPEAQVVLQFKEGKALISATDAIQLLSASVELGNGVIPPSDKYILSTAFLAELLLVMTEIGPLIPSPAATAMAGKLTASLTPAGLPFLSNLVKGQ